MSEGQGNDCPGIHKPISAERKLLQSKHIVTIRAPTYSFPCLKPTTLLINIVKMDNPQTINPPINPEDPDIRSTRADSAETDVPLDERGNPLRFKPLPQRGLGSPYSEALIKLKKALFRLDRLSQNVTSKQSELLSPATRAVREAKVLLKRVEGDELRERARRELRLGLENHGHTLTIKPATFKFLEVDEKWMWEHKGTTPDAWVTIMVTARREGAVAQDGEAEEYEEVEEDEDDDERSVGMDTARTTPETDAEDVIMDEADQTLVRLY